MKNKIAVVLTALMTATLLVACGSSNAAENQEPTSTETTAEAEAAIPSEPTEAPHEHNYTETITTPATCKTDGEATYTCECGDSYTEPIATQGHVFESYTSNNDATYTADGTDNPRYDRANFPAIIP